MEYDKCPLSFVLSSFVCETIQPKKKKKKSPKFGIPWDHTSFELKT